MVIIDKEYIALKFKHALIERGYVETEIKIEATMPNVRTLKYMGEVVFSLIIIVSLVSEIPPVITVDTKTTSIDMISLCDRADELLKKKTKIFLN